MWPSCPYKPLSFQTLRYSQFLSNLHSVTKIQIFSFREEIFSSAWCFHKKSASSDKIVPLQFGTEVEVGRDSSPDCRDFIVLQLLFLLLEVIWKRSPTESSVPVKICNNECKLSISILPFLAISVQKSFLKVFLTGIAFFFLRKYIHIFIYSEKAKELWRNLQRTFDLFKYVIM